LCVDGHERVALRSLSRDIYPTRGGVGRTVAHMIGRLDVALAVLHLVVLLTVVVSFSRAGSLVFFQPYLFIPYVYFYVHHNVFLTGCYILLASVLFGYV